MHTVYSKLIIVYKYKLQHIQKNSGKHFFKKIKFFGFSRYRTYEDLSIHVSISVGRGGSGAPGTWGGSSAPPLSCIYMKREDHQKSGIKPQPYTTIIPNFVGLRLNLHIKKKS